MNKIVQLAIASILALHIVFISVMSAPQSVFAETSTPIPSGLALCEEYVQPTNLLVSLSSELSETIQGGSFVVTGALSNRSDIPFIDISAYVKIVSKDGSLRLIDVLPALSHITITPGVDVPFFTTWHVPNDMPLGTYAAEAIIVVGERNAVIGQFDKEISGSPIYFDVVGESVGDVFFQPEKIKINDTAVKNGDIIFAHFDGPLTLSVQIANESAEPLKADVEWKIYGADGPWSDRLIQESATQVKIHPKKTGSADVRIDDSVLRDYFVVGELSRGDKMTKIFLRIARSTIAEPRIISAGVAEPRSATGLRAAFVCIASHGLQSDDVTINLSASRLGMWGFLNLFGYLASARFEGSIPVHLPYALAVPLNSDQQVSVTAELYHGGVIIDEVTVPYATTADKAVAAVIPILLIVGVIVFILVFRRSFVKK